MSAASEDAMPEGADFPMPVAGESLSVAAMMRRHHSQLISFLRRRLRTPEDAADVAQETYIRMMQYEGSRDIRAPFAMLFHIATNVANDFGRSQLVRRTSRQCSLDDLHLASSEPSPERHLAASQELEKLYGVIERLPPRCQQVFLLSRVDQMTYPQIAAHCGISVKMVEKHISHALALCLRKVGEGR